MNYQIEEKVPELVSPLTVWRTALVSTLLECSKSVEEYHISYSAYDAQSSIIWGGQVLLTSFTGPCNAKKYLG